jgi:hypothetical protein
MKSLMFLTLLMVSQSAFSQVITCNDNGCVPDSISAIVAEKATYSAIDLGFNTNDSFSVLTGTGSSIRPLRLSLSNGEFPGKNMVVDLSANANAKNAGSLIVIGDNIDTLSVSLNGYSGKGGNDASQLCATRILGGLYGSDVRLRFLQRRSSPSSGLTNDRCAQVDIDDIATNKFSCNDSSYTSLDLVDPKLNITEVRKNSKCLAIAPQSVCLQKKYQLSCNIKLGVSNGSGGFDLWDDARNKFQESVGCQNYGNCAEFPPCFGNDYLRVNGTTIWSNGGPSTSQDYQFTKNYYLDAEQLNFYRSNGGGDICQQLINGDSEWSTSANNFEMYVFYNGKHNYNGNAACYMTDHNTSGAVGYSSSQMKWFSVGGSNPVETSPGLNVTRDGLEGGLGLHPSPHGNGAIAEINHVNNGTICQGPVGQLPPNFTGPGGQKCQIVDGWQMETMPSFYPKGTADESRPLCNPYFSFTNTKTENLVKTLFDPNQFTNNSTFCVDQSNSANCSHPPFCDDPNSSLNCRKVSSCEQINTKNCLDNTNSANCSHPPFCDNPLDPTNCSTTSASKSCEVGGPAENNFCDKDGNNLAQYQLIGTEPDPLKNTQSVDCKINNCPVQFKTIESSSFLDTLTPSAGENGTLPGSGLFFVYDIRSVSSQATPGQAGAGGKSDLNSAVQVRYCGNKRDFTTDPNTQYENDPQVTFKKVLWKAFDVKPGATPGQFPPFTDKKVEIYKKVDSSIRYLLKKELL